MQLTPHFSWNEAVKTSTGLANIPSPVVSACVGVTAMHMERVRALLGKPIIVTSWYRTPAVNRRVGGSETSDHMDGFAVDFKCPSYGSNYDVAMRIWKGSQGAYPDDPFAFKFDQLILEYGWVHISFAPRLRGDVMTKKSASSPYMKGLIK